MSSGNGFLEGRLGHADRETRHQCSIEDCDRPAVKAVWLEAEDSEEVHLYMEHFKEVTTE